MRFSRARTVVALVAFLVPSAVSADAPSRAAGQPVLATLLARYAAAADDAGSGAPARYVASGTLSGEGLTGTFASWHDSDRERDDQALGPRSEEMLGLGERLYLRDAYGAVRELRGVLLRRARTERFIDDGAFLHFPERCAYRGTTSIGARLVQILDVTAPGGQTETLYLDDRTALPVRLAFDDDDGRTTIDFDDWRTVAGHRFPFRSVESNGDHAFDVTALTTRVEVVPNVPPDTFDVPVGRVIDMPAAQTVPLDVRDSHLYVPVRLEGREYRFLLDSGAASVVVDERVARTLGLAEEGVLEVSGASRTAGLHLAKLPDLAIGSGHLRNIVVETVDLGGSTRGAFRIDGILGAPLFEEATVRLDAEKRMMTFGPPGSLVSSGTPLPLELDRSLPEATLRLNNDVDGQFVVDTGNASEMLLYRPFIDRHPGLVPFTTTQRSSYGLGGGMWSYSTNLDELTIAGIPMYHSNVDVILTTSGAFADRFTAGNIGLGILKNFVLTFDEPKATLYVEKSAQFDDGRYRYR